MYLYVSRSDIQANARITMIDIRYKENVLLFLFLVGYLFELHCIHEHFGWLSENKKVGNIFLT